MNTLLADNITILFPIGSVSINLHGDSQITFPSAARSLHDSRGSIFKGAALESPQFNLFAY